MLKVLQIPLRMIRWSALGALLAATLKVGAPAAAEQNVDELLQHFDNVVFGSEFAGVARATQIQKWVSPVRLSISAMQGDMVAKPDGGRELKLRFVRPEDAHVSLIRKHLTTLVRLTGIKSEKSGKDRDNKPNFFIKFMPRLAMGQPFVAKDIDPKLLARLGQSGVCYFLTQPTRTGAMFRALIVVNIELPLEAMDACLLEEMTQALGLPNDSDIVTPSVFNQTSTQRTLSESDVMVVKTLYDHRLPAGTPRADALRIGRTILAEQLGGG